MEGSTRQIDFHVIILASKNAKGEIKTSDDCVVTIQPNYTIWQNKIFNNTLNIRRDFTNQ